MFLKVTSATTGDEMYINIDNVKALVSTNDYQTLITFIDNDTIIVEESIDELLEEDEDDY